MFSGDPSRSCQNFPPRLVLFRVSFVLGHPVSIKRKIDRSSKLMLKLNAFIITHLPKIQCLQMIKIRCTLEVQLILNLWTVHIYFYSHIYSEYWGEIGNFFFRIQNFPEFWSFLAFGNFCIFSRAFIQDDYTWFLKSLNPALCSLNRSSSSFG